MSLGMTPCVASERLLAVAMSNDLLFTAEEFVHLEECKDCFERWQECVAQAGRHFEQGN
jgi:hypothetical protein